VLRLLILLATAMSASAAQYGRLPLQFEPNVGQAHPSARYIARAADYRFFITDIETVFELSDSPHSTVRMKLSGAIPGARLEPLEKLPGISNYYLGNDPSKWRTNVPQYARLKRHDVYPGIDMVFYGSEGHLEYDCIVKPGADASRIRLTYEGVERLRLDSNGDLLLAAGSHELRQKKPVVYQQGPDGQRQEVQGSYQLAASGKEVGFSLGDYDRTRALVVDPALVYVAYPRGSDVGDSAFGIAVDGAGNAYITGRAASTDFPTVLPAQPNNAGAPDAFIAKLNASGTALIYSTYLGGADTDYGQAIAVDNNGNAYVAGVTLSSNFPVKSAAQAAKPGGMDGFVTKLDAQGAIVFSTYLGGSSVDLATAIAVDGLANVYIAGSSSSPNFPTINALQPSLRGISNVFVAKLNPSGSGFLFSTYLGSAGNSLAAGLALGLDGSIWIAGSAGPLFPTVNPIQQAYGGGQQDAFVAKLDNSGSSLLFSTFLGGSDADAATSIVVDRFGNVLVAGSTYSANFPLVSPLQASIDNVGVGFVAKLSPNPPALLYSTYFSGGGMGMVSVAADNAGNVTIGGEFLTLSGFELFPLIYPLPSTSAALAYAAQISADGTTLLYSTFVLDTLSTSFKGSITSVNAVAVDNAGNAYLAGGGALFVVKLSQATARCDVTVTSVSSRTFPAAGGTGTVSFLNPNACEFPVISTAASSSGVFVRYDPTMVNVRQTSGQLPFTVLPNLNLARQASLLVNGIGITITQDAGYFPPAGLSLIGSWDTPATSVNASGVLAISGWALSPNPINVEIYRNAVPGEQTVNGRVFLGNGTFVSGSRPDIAAQHPEFTSRNNAGWSYALLTNTLPNSDGSSGKGTGTYQISVVIQDQAKQLPVVFRTISVSNGNFSKPFGTIDTPAPGAIISGKSYVNFGWALTPQPALIPFNGSTINVFVDGKPQGALSSYNNFRADIAAALPGYQNSNGAVGFAKLDTTALSNGQHTIAWGVTDNNNQTNSVGNRTFTVLDGTAAAQSLEGHSARAVHRTPPVPKPRAPFGDQVLLRKGYDLEAPYERLVPDRTWAYGIVIEQLDRLELRFVDIDSKPVACGENLTLPVGSTLDSDTCTFYWQIDASFLGEYQLVFSTELGDVRVHVMVRSQLMR
jgi:Beta-propeller repeat